MEKRLRNLTALKLITFYQTTYEKSESKSKPKEHIFKKYNSEFASRLEKCYRLLKIKKKNPNSEMIKNINRPFNKGKT